MKNGIDINLALQLSDEKRAAFCIVFAQYEGAEFDWNSFMFKEKR